MATTVMDAQGFDELVRRAQEGSREAMDELLTTLRPYLLGIAREFVDPARATESASDLVQEAGIRAWDRLEQFCGGDADADTLAMFRTWIAQITRRLGLDAHRRRSAQKRRPAGAQLRITSGGTESERAGATEPAGTLSTPSAQVRADEESEIVRRAVAELADPLERQVLELHFFEGLSLRRIAEHLDLTYDRVREPYRRAMRRLESRLSGLL